MTGQPSPASPPWWHRRRRALHTAVALLVVPAVLGVALLAGGAFHSDRTTPAAVAEAPEVQGPAIPSSAIPSTAPTTPAPTTPAPTTPAPAAVAPAAAPAASNPPPTGPVTSTAPIAPATAPQPALGEAVAFAQGSAAADLKVWQQRMADRGWTIEVDGIFGAHTAGVVQAFQSEKRLSVDGIIGPKTWAAAWTFPVTT